MSRNSKPLLFAPHVVLCHSYPRVASISHKYIHRRNKTMIFSFCEGTQYEGRRVIREDAPVTESEVTAEKMEN
ncbi:hypothetical protein BDZ89DRAFT_490221 [Hymenopellis radicata]|nr:hypothetical protein BDZ89DRAFT_490221 [Hymenopellis radicata]